MNMILGAPYTVLTSICLYEDTGAFVERLGCGEVFIVLNTDGVKWSNVSVCQVLTSNGMFYVFYWSFHRNTMILEC